MIRNFVFIENMTFKTREVAWQPWKVLVSNSIGEAVKIVWQKFISIVWVLNPNFNLYKMSFTSSSLYRYISFALFYVIAQGLQLIHE